MSGREQSDVAPHSERPLVTFALFAYNQERFIREAVEGAFAQTYEPLEIILSDDCSTDNTFSIMQELADGYTGSHSVRVRRTTANRGTFNHVLEVAKLMKGRVLVLAAGDDISRPNRTSVVVQNWIEHEAVGLHSSFDVIDEHGAVLAREKLASPGRGFLRWFGIKENMYFVHGATSAYDETLFRDLPYSSEPILSEDAVLSFRLALDRLKCICIGEPLVAYRQHNDAISHAPLLQQGSVQDIRVFEQKIARAAASFVALCNYCDFLRSQRAVVSRELDSRTRDDVRFAKIRARWIEATLRERLRMAASCRSWRELRFLVPRLFGLNSFVAFKRFSTRLIGLRQ